MTCPVNIARNTQHMIMVEIHAPTEGNAQIRNKFYLHFLCFALLSTLTSIHTKWFTYTLPSLTVHPTPLPSICNNLGVKGPSAISGPGIDLTSIVPSVHPTAVPPMCLPSVPLWMGVESGPPVIDGKGVTESQMAHPNWMDSRPDFHPKSVTT